MPDMSVAIAILFTSFVVLLVIRMPISFTLAVSSVLTALYLRIPLPTLFQRMVNGVQSFSLMAIPFFILAGEIMGQGGISSRLIKLANACVGWMRGGLAQVNILASMFFGGISGSAVADTSSIGAILIPMMNDSGYDNDFSVAVTVTSSCQGVMIPPSHNMILFAMAAILLLADYGGIRKRLPLCRNKNHALSVLGVILWLGVCAFLALMVGVILQSILEDFLG